MPKIPDQDLYQILGVRPDATPDQIRQAYRRRAKEYHPDLLPAERRAAATERLKAINEAYEWLSDRTKRLDYDRSRAARPFPYRNIPTGPFSARPTNQRYGTAGVWDIFGQESPLYDIGGGSPLSGFRFPEDPNPRRRYGSAFVEQAAKVEKSLNRARVLSRNLWARRESTTIQIPRSQWTAFRDTLRSYEMAGNDIEKTTFGMRLLGLIEMYPNLIYLFSTRPED